jgi:hypothetical protein
VLDRDAYRRRSVVERCVGWLKQARRIATRFEKTAGNFLMMPQLAMIQRYLRECSPVTASEPYETEPRLPRLSPYESGPARDSSLPQISLSYSENLRLADGPSLRASVTSTEAIRSDGRHLEASAPTSADLAHMNNRSEATVGFYPSAVSRPSSVECGATSRARSLRFDTK